jgi:histidyl-tRNA synthetase
MSEDAFRKGALLARSLRTAGVSVEVGSAAKLKRSMELANKSGARFALLIGEEELAQQRYALKDLETGAQRAVDEAELIEALAAAAILNR